MQVTYLKSKIHRATVTQAALNYVGSITIDEELMAMEKYQYPVGTENKLTDKLSMAAAEYGLGRTTVVRLVRINELCDELKKLVDTGNIKIRSAVELSYIPKDAQKRLYERMSAMGENSIDLKTAKELRQTYRAYNDFTEEQIAQVMDFINKGKLSEEKPHKISLTPEVFDKYFTNVPRKEVARVIEMALEMYFKTLAT